MHAIEDFNGVPCLLRGNSKVVTLDYSLSKDYEPVPNFEGRSYSFGRDDAAMIPAFMVAVLASWVFQVAARGIVNVDAKTDGEIVSTLEWFTLACRGGLVHLTVIESLYGLAEAWRLERSELDRVLALPAMIETLLLAKDVDQRQFALSADKDIVN